MAGLRALWLVVAVVASGCCLPGVVDGAAEIQHHANRLTHTLFSNYTTLIRPRVNQSHTVQVSFDIAMKQVIDVDVKTQQMTLFLWQRQTWYDEFLRWNPAEFGDIDQLFISPTKIWISDVIFQNSVDDFEQLKDTTIIKALVLYTGQVYFFRPTLKSTTCKMSVRYFPYDSQVCAFQVGSWMLSEDQVDIQVLSFDSEVSGFVTHHEWDLSKRATFRRSLVVPVDMGTLQRNMSFPYLEFLFLFDRKPEFFEKNLIVPTALICALSIVAFLLPNESGEKIGFSITVFLSLCVNLVVITSYVPASSESFPIIGQYYLTCIFLVAVSIVLTTCILSVHYFGDQYFIKPLPKPVKVLFFQVLAPIVGMQFLKSCHSWGQFCASCKSSSSCCCCNQPRRRSSFTETDISRVSPNPAMMGRKNVTPSASAVRFNNNPMLLSATYVPSESVVDRKDGGLPHVVSNYSVHRTNSLSDGSNEGISAGVRVLSNHNSVDIIESEMHESTSCGGGKLINGDLKSRKPPPPAITRSVTASPVRQPPSAEPTAAESALASSFTDVKKSLMKIEHYLDSVAKASEKKKKKCATIEEWKLLSRILDRIFAIAYGLTTIFCTCYYFYQAKTGAVVDLSTFSFE